MLSVHHGEPDSHLKLLPTSFSDTCKVFKHIDMLSMGIQQQPYTVIPTLLGSVFWVLGHLWSHNVVIMSWSRLTTTSNYFPHHYQTNKKFLSTLICCPWVYSSSLTQLCPPNLASIWGLWVTYASQNDAILSWLRLTATSNCFLHQFQTYKSV